MNSSHRRPLVAYVLVSVAGAVVVAQGLAGIGVLPGLQPLLTLDAAEQRVSDGQLLLQTPPEGPSGNGGSGDQGATGGGSILQDGINVDDESLTLGSGTPAAAPEPETADQVVVAAPEPAPTGPDRANPDGPALGGPALGAPGAEAPADDEGDPSGADPEPAPHSSSDTDATAHPSGTAQPPRGQGSGQDTGKETGKDKRVAPETDAQAAPAAPAHGSGEPDHAAQGPARHDDRGKPHKADKPDKTNHGKALAKGKGKGKAGTRGR